MAKGKYFWFDDKLDKLKQLTDEKKSIEEIAKYFGKSKEAILMAISRHKIKERKLKPETKIKIKQLTEEDLASRIAWLKGEAIKPEIPEVVFTDKEIKAWLKGMKGFKLFCRQVLKVKMLPHQIEITKNAMKKKRLAVLGGRGVGKDFWASVFILYQVITNSNFKCLIVSSAERQSVELGERIFRNIGMNDKLIASVVKSNREQIVFKNNSVIYLLPSTSFIRGYQNLNLVVVNEASFIPSSRDFVESVIMPMISVNGTLVLLSTPLASSNDDIMWSAWNNPLFAKLHYPSSMNKKRWNKEALEEVKLLTSNQNYLREYEAQFVSAENCFFDSKIIDKCCKDYDFVSEAEANKRYYIGYDPARIRDSSVIVVVSEDENKIAKVELIKEFYNTPFSEQEAFILYLNQKFKPVWITVEYAGLGIAPADSLEEKGLPVYKFNPSAEKLQAYEHFRAKMERGEIIFPLGYPKLIIELKFFQYQILSSGKVSLHSESSGSDDIADATCFALWKTRTEEWRPMSEETMKKWEEYIG